MRGNTVRVYWVFPAVIYVLVMRLPSDIFCTCGLASSSIRSAPVYRRSIDGLLHIPTVCFCFVVITRYIDRLSWLVLTPRIDESSLFIPSPKPSSRVHVICRIVFDHHVGYSVSLCRKFAYLFPLLFDFLRIISRGLFFYKKLDRCACPSA